MKWLLTGGVGFIGYHLSDALLGRGDVVTVLDDFSDAPYPEAEKRRNAADLARAYPKTGALRIVEGCVTDAALVAQLASGSDGVIHLAGLAGVRPSFREPARYARVNVEGSAILFEAARIANVGTFLFASSSSVYGNSTPLPAREDAPCVQPESPYAASKRSAELLVSSLTVPNSPMRVTALRFFTVYGPRQRPEMAITTFTRAMLGGHPIRVFGDGSMLRDFTHVSDIVRGILAAAERAPAGYRAYNLGSGSPISLRDLVEAIGAATQRKPAVEHDVVPRGDVDATFADLTRSSSELGWDPRVPLSAGLATVVDWVRENR